MRDMCNHKVPWTRNLFGHQQIHKENAIVIESELASPVISQIYNMVQTPVSSESDALYSRVHPNAMHAIPLVYRALTTMHMLKQKSLEPQLCRIAQITHVHYISHLYSQVRETPYSKRGIRRGRRCDGRPWGYQVVKGDDSKE